MAGLFDSNGLPLLGAKAPDGRDSSLGVVPGKMALVQVKFATTGAAQDILQLANVQAALQWYVPAPQLAALLAGPGLLAQVEVIFDAVTQVNVNALGYQDLVADSVWDSGALAPFNTLVAKDISSGLLRVLMPGQQDPTALPNVSV